MKHFPFRIGEGHDIHRLVPDRELILGGVKLECELGLLGHSDADALCHAITDAILGAAALGDIGRHFPDTDERFKGADSLKLLSHAVILVRDAGYEIGNIDSTVVAQKPKMAPHIDSMRENLARALGIDVSCVSVKAKTNEKLDAVGRMEAIETYAAALIYKAAE